MPHNPKQTGKEAASAASKELRSNKSTPAEKTVAGSDLTQAPLHKKPNGKKAK